MAIVSPDRPKMLLSLPSHGTDWLARLIAAQPGIRYYDKEFFNPICNLEYQQVLAHTFGCELVSCYRNIATCPADDVFDFTLDRTWRKETYNFNKENFSLTKAGLFAKHFDCVMLHREADSVFPPKRLRVYQWYDAIWCALRDANHWVYGISEHLDIEDRAIIAHKKMWEIGFQKARQHSIPILSYDLLVKGSESEILSHLQCFNDWGIDPAALTKLVTGTRINPQEI